jgi:hypothetical protein
MKRMNSCGLAALALILASQAMAGLPKDSPLRLKDCVPYDMDSLKRLKALREKVRAEFVKQGGARAKNLGTDAWHPAWVLTDDWTPIIGDEGIIGLDSKTQNMAALIPSGWTQSATGTKPAGYDPVTEVEATRAALGTWAPGVASEASFFHPGIWDVRVSSPSNMREGEKLMARFYFEAGPPELWVNVSPRPVGYESVRWSEASIGNSARNGSTVLGVDVVTAYGRTCQVTYLERPSWKNPETGKETFTGEAVLGCVSNGTSGDAEDLLVVIKTSEYETPGAPTEAALKSYNVARRSFCTITMPDSPLKR